MSKGNLFYLVARNRDNSDFVIVPISGRKGTSLEEIDLFTTGFSSEEELTQHFRELHSKDVDWFIVNQSRIQNKVVLKRQEVLYSNSKRIQKIAENSMNHEMGKSQVAVDQILDSFADKMTYDGGFYSDVVGKRTNVYDKYIRYFVFHRAPSLSSIKYRDGGWARSSYPLIRNIIESYARSDNYYRHMSDELHRSLIEQKLIRVTDPNYDENQLSMFDMVHEDMIDDLLLEVMSRFESLPKDVFLLDKEGDETTFRTSYFSHYEGDDLEKFQTYLTPELRLCLRLFTVHRDTMEKEYASSQQVPIQQGLKTMIKLLREDSDVLNHACLWCRLFDQYEEKAMGDVDERGYQKRKQS